MAKETENMHENMRMYKLELETSKQIESSNKLEKDNYRTREHDREMKKLKEKVEDLVDELRSKELKLSDLEVANAELQADIKLTRTKTQAEGMQKCEELMQERSALRRELDSVSSDFKFYKNKYNSLAGEQSQNQREISSF